MKKLVLFLQPVNNKLDIKLDLNSSVHAVVLQQNGADVSDSMTKQSEEILLNQSIEQVLEYFSADILEQNIRTTLVIPGENILKCDLKVPAKQFRQVQKALPYLVEDQIASDPEDCFIAIGERNDEVLSCAIIQRDTISQYHTFLADNHLNAEKIISDDGLISSNSANLLIFENRALLSTIQNKTFAFDLSLLGIYLDKLKSSDQNEDAENPLVPLDDNDVEAITSADLEENAFKKKSLNIVFYQYEEKSLVDTKDRVFSEIEQYKKNQGLEYEVSHIDKSFEEYCLESARVAVDRHKDPQSINFLQGEYKLKRIANNFKIDFNWKPLAYLSSAFIILYLVSVFVETKKYEYAAEEAEIKTKAVFKEIFPKTKNYSRMKDRVSSLLKGNVAPTDNQFLKMIYLFSEAMQEINGKNEDAIKPTQIQYEQGNSELKADVIASDFDTLNSLKETAESLGLIFEISSTSSESSGVKGRLKVKIKP